MKSTGVIRRIDELGRIVIPKEIRKNMRIKDGENLEIFIENDNIILKKYSSMSNLKDISIELCHSIYSIFKHNVVVCDLDSVIAVSGVMRKEFIDKRIGIDLENFLRRREVVFHDSRKKIEIVSGYLLDVLYVGSPIVANGDVVGFILMFDENVLFKGSRDMVLMVAQFLGKYLES